MSILDKDMVDTLLKEGDCCRLDVEIPQNLKWVIESGY